MFEKPNHHPKLDSSYFGWFYGMGSGLHSEENPHALTWRLPAVTERFTEIYEKHGAKVCIRHRPFGETEGGPMDLDQASTVMRDPKWSWLISSYHIETEKLLEKCPEAIVIDYYGTIEDQLKGLYSEGKYTQLIKRMLEGVKPSLNKKVWIAFDAASGSHYTEGNPFHYFAEMIGALKRHQGCDIVTEALPAIGEWKVSEWSQHQHALCLERFYQHRIKNFPNLFRFTSDKYTTFRVANGHSRSAWDEMTAQGIDPLEDYLVSCMNNGHTPIWAMPGYSFEDMVSRWNEMQ